MSLFPAYPSEKDAEKSNSNQTEELPSDNKVDWLRNVSFQSGISFNKPTDISTSSSSSDLSENDSNIQVPSSSKLERIPENIKIVTSPKDINSRKHKKKKKRKSRIEKKYEPKVENVYFEDRILDTRMCTVDTLCSRVRPLYNLSEYNLTFISGKRWKKRSVRRYYSKNIDMIEQSKKKDTIIKRTKTNEPEETLPEWCVNIEEEQKIKTQDFNKMLEENPNDIEIWLRFIEFQDDAIIYQPFKNNSRSILEKKLSIVEKGLEKNPDSLDLEKMKLFLMSELLPADQFSNELETLLSRNSGNLILWQTLIMTIQSSVALCSSPSVLNLFTRCLFILRQRSRANPRIYDAQVLNTMFQCLMFLRHAGLWEQMWETIRMNLCLNLDLRRENLQFQSSIDEKNLIGMEEVILTSKLPLNQLWLRVESLRERCHWLSVTSDQLELVGDSKRFVLPEDVADFVHPLVSRNSNFHLAIYSLLALKVPLLPTRDSTLKSLGLKDLNWIFDSLEVLLPFAYPCVGETAGFQKRKSLVEGLIQGQLTSGPQYLRFHPAQEPFLEFLRSTFRVIAEALPPLERTSIYIWWLRFERMLVYFGKDDPLKSDNRGKKLKNIVKEFLKKAENRNNLHFYREYALIEYEQGHFESSATILETVLASNNFCPATMKNADEKLAAMSIYRTLFEILLNTRTYCLTNIEKMKKIAMTLVPETSGNRLLLAYKFLRESVDDFLSHEIIDESIDAFFLPNIMCDTITCCAYLSLILDRSISEITSMFRKCLEHCKDAPELKERLYESELALLQFHGEKIHESNLHLKEILNEASLLYPDNFYFLSVFADVEYELPTWRQKKSGKIRLWRAITMCMAENSRIKVLKENNLLDESGALLNKLLSFYRKLARNPDIRHCPLLWRLFILLLRDENLSGKKGEDAYHESVINCPWARCIYIDSAEIAPQQLTQIQDVIRGKELRIHVTPEELDILRS